MENKITPHHVGISVSNLDESIGWYRDMLGFSLVDRVYVEHLNCDIAIMECGGFQLELFGHRCTKPLPAGRRHPDEDMITQGTKHICFTVTGLDAFVEGLVARGVKVIVGPGEFGGNRFYYICDNDGVLIELNEAL